jgi:hypothetical protein
MEIWYVLPAMAKREGEPHTLAATDTKRIKTSVEVAGIPTDQVQLNLSRIERILQLAGITRFTLQTRPSINHDGKYRLVFNDFDVKRALETEKPKTAQWLPLKTQLSSDMLRKALPENATPEDVAKLLQNTLHDTLLVAAYSNLFRPKLIELITAMCFLATTGFTLAVGDLEGTLQVLCLFEVLNLIRCVMNSRDEGREKAGEGARFSLTGHSVGFEFDRFIFAMILLQLPLVSVLKNRTLGNTETEDTLDEDANLAK